MDIQRAKQILTILADGINPMTGEVLPDDDSCNQVQVVRALHAAILALDRADRRAKEQPQNAGTFWSEDEIDKLIDEHDSGMTISAIAKEHSRSRGAIESKLAGLGIIEKSYFIRKRR